MSASAETATAAPPNLDAIRAREQAVTPGPWTPDTYRSVLAGLATKTGNHAADADFIRHSRTDVPAMADEIEQLRAQVLTVAERHHIICFLRAYIRLCGHRIDAGHPIRGIVAKLDVEAVQP